MSLFNELLLLLSNVEIFYTPMMILIIFVTVCVLLISFLIISVLSPLGSDSPDLVRI